VRKLQTVWSHGTLQKRKAPDMEAPEPTVEELWAIASGAAVIPAIPPKMESYDATLWFTPWLMAP
jgi:hypothetical protein